MCNKRCNRIKVLFGRKLVTSCEAQQIPGIGIDIFLHLVYYFSYELLHSNLKEECILYNRSLSFAKIGKEELDVGTLLKGHKPSIKS